MKIQLNGAPTEVPDGERIGSLLSRLGIDAARVAVERNLEIVPKARFTETILSEGDRIEIVHFVGGG